MHMARRWLGFGMSIHIVAHRTSQCTPPPYCDEGICMLRCESPPTIYQKYAGGGPRARPILEFGSNLLCRTLSIEAPHRSEAPSERVCAHRLISTLVHKEDIRQVSESVFARSIGLALERTITSQLCGIPCNQTRVTWMETRIHSIFAVEINEKTSRLPLAL